MEITLNHTLVPTKDNVLSAKFYERIFGFKFLKMLGPFAIVRINKTLSLDLKNENEISSLHLAFKITDEQFDEIFERIKNEGLEFGSGPHNLNNGKTNKGFGGRGVYFKDLDGHILEILTTGFALD